MIMSATNLDYFYSTLVKIISINDKTLDVLIPSICKHTIITLNKNVIPIMFYGVLVGRYNPVLFAKINTKAHTGVYTTNVDDLIIKDWELPDFDGTDWDYKIISRQLHL